MDYKKMLKEIKNELANHIVVTRVYLFGSRARGVFHTDSDYDIAVLSPDFEKMSFDDRDDLVRPLIRKVLGYVPLDIACYTTDEYERGRVGFLPQTIEEEGIAV